MKLRVAFRNFSNASKNDKEPTSYCFSLSLSLHEDKPSLCPPAMHLCPTKQNHSVSGLREMPTSAGFSYHLSTCESKKETESRCWLLDYVEQNRTGTAEMWRCLSSDVHFLFPTWLQGTAVRVLHYSISVISLFYVECCTSHEINI